MSDVSDKYKEPMQARLIPDFYSLSPENTFSVLSKSLTSRFRCEDFKSTKMESRMPQKTVLPPTLLLPGNHPTWLSLALITVKEMRLYFKLAALQDAGNSFAGKQQSC